ncbi:UNVERIFIED_CONTAM: hypothetical protein GTU68_003210 [Idotea baltica]|nr:hypothetical protein [Idotea baltica]
MTNAISKMISETSKKMNVDESVLFRGAMTSVCCLYAYKVILPRVTKIYENRKKKKMRIEPPSSAAKLTKLSPAVNKEFWVQLKKLLKVLIPTLWCKSSFILLLHTITLITRTFLSIYVAQLEGKVVKYIVKKDIFRFALMITKWITVAIPATFVNSMIRFLESHLAMSFRSSLVKYSYELYFKRQCYYRVANLDGRIENADHCLTDDISAFSSSIAHLYSHITKPILDALLITYSLAALGKSRGGASIPGPVIGAIVVTVTGQILRAVSPKFGKLVAEEASRKGYLRSMHSRIITNGEEIAFYGGHKVELGILKKAYASLVHQMNLIYYKKLWYIMLEQFLMKYVWSGAGMVMVSIPLLTSTRTESEENDDGVSGRTEYFTTAKNMLTSGADAIERLMTSYKEIVELAGYTARVGNMLEVFEDVQEQKYQRPSVMNEGEEKLMQREGMANLVLRNGMPVIMGDVTESCDGTIIIEDLPVVTPNCDIIVRSLTITVTPEMHLLISGPNGCGKSSLFRILSGLWPVYRGRLQKPINKDMFYIPQR